MAERFRSSPAGATLFIEAPALAFKTTLLIAAAILIMLFDRREGALRPVRSTLSVVVYPLQWAVDAPFALGRWVGENLASRQALIDRAAAFEAQNLTDQVRLQRLAALEVENARLRELMSSSRRLVERVAVGELLSVDLDPFRHRVVVDKGLPAGAYEGMPIVDSSGVMGQIVSVGPLTSQAILITDASHALPVEVNRNGLRTIAVGTGDIDRLELPYLPNSADVREGDLLVTSGLGGRFPRGYPVGVVRKVTRDPTAAFARIDAAPAAALNRSREVLLVFTGAPFVGPPTLETP
jgi:rod shape-determining protein MreC